MFPRELQVKTCDISMQIFSQIKKNLTELRNSAVNTRIELWISCNTRSPIDIQPITS